MTYVRVFRGLYILLAMPPTIIVGLRDVSLSDWQINLLVACANMAVMMFGVMMVCAVIDMRERPNA